MMAEFVFVTESVFFLFFYFTFFLQKFYKSFMATRINETLQ